MGRRVDAAREPRGNGETRRAEVACQPLGETDARRRCIARADDGDNRRPKTAGLPRTARSGGASSIIISRRG